MPPRAKKLADLTRDILAGDGVPVPGHWGTSIQAVMHWQVTQQIAWPLERMQGSTLCKNQPHHLMNEPPIYIRARARHCHLCLYHVRRAVATRDAMAADAKKETP